MKIIDLAKYGPILGSKTIGDEIFHIITKELGQDKKITVDLSEIKSMATFCAKQIFGQLYLQLGSKDFFDRIIIKGADNDLKTIIQIGIQHAIEDNKKTSS